MKSVARGLAGIAVLLLTIAPSWGQLVNPVVSDDNFNTAGGSKALANIDDTPNTGGLFNTAFGAFALSSNTTGSANTAVGEGALSAAETANNNTGIGIAALGSNTDGHDNTGVGMSVLISNTTGNQNTAVGSSALITNGKGQENTAVGFAALFTNETGHRNTAIGRTALRNSTGGKNIAIGYRAGLNLETGNNNIYLGSEGAATESLTMRLGSIQTSTFIAGVFGTSVAGGTPVEIDANGQLGTSPSSARYKQDIEGMGARSAGVLALRPVTFVYRDDAQGTTRYGLIAEEVAAVYPGLVTRTAAGEAQTVRYQELIPMLLNELQRQQQELAELRAIVKEHRDMRQTEALASPPAPRRMD